MNFLAHLCLANGDPGLMMGGLLGDFVRGRRAMRVFPEPIRQGIVLHRYIDKCTDRSPVIKNLRPQFSREFRRYAGIIIDLAFDHELAVNWWRYMPGSLERFDVETRDLLSGHTEWVPEKLTNFMRYADRHGLFSAYRKEEVILQALAGIGTRLSRPNPLHRVAEIWPELAPEFKLAFRQFFPQIQSEVLDWRSRNSTTTGS
jgi:acyl carrier protein phosphodiesterase